MQRGRPLSPADRTFLSHLAQELISSPHLPLDQPSHIMISGRGSSPPPSPLIDAGTRASILGIVGRVLPEYCEVSRGHHALLSVRLLFSPPGTSAQAFHLDYRSFEGLEAHTVFVAMSPATDQNCTEVVTFRRSADQERFERRVRARPRACETGSAAVVRVRKPEVLVRPLLMEQHDVVCLPTHRVVHRRSQNTSAFCRVTLNIDFTTISAEKLTAIGFVDDDCASAHATAGVVGRNVVDDLHSEVVVEIVDDDGEDEDAGAGRERGRQRGRGGSPGSPAEEHLRPPGRARRRRGKVVASL